MKSAVRRPILSEEEFLRLPESTAKIEFADDRVTKRLLYAAAGVTGYWVVEPAGLVERWTGPGLTRERLTTPLLPGFSLDLRRLFAVRPAQ